jgi:hypothetical protein
MKLSGDGIMMLILSFVPAVLGLFVLGIVMVWQ